MTAIETDRRRIEAEPDPDAEARLRELVPVYLDVRLEIARLLARLEGNRTFVLSGCASIEEYAIRLAVPRADARLLVDVGRALAWEAREDALGSGAQGPDAASIEERIRSGDIPLENASALGALAHTSGAMRPDEPWLQAASEMGVRDFRMAVRNRLEEVKQGETVTPLTLHVTERARQGFARARAVASERAGERLSEGETFALVIEHYLDACAPERRGEGTRRLPDTAEDGHGRYVPAEVKREVRRRAGLRCEVPGCAHDTFLEFAHVEPHREHGSREARNLVLLCPRHHTLLDAGRIVCVGFEDGHPIFATARGERLTDRAVDLRAGASPAVRDGRAVAGVVAADDPLAGQVAERPPPWEVRQPRACPPRAESGPRRAGAVRARA
jgi:hypothetical protein